MNELKIFENRNFGSMRTINEDGKMLFCGSDVAKALGYDQPHKAISAHCRYSTKCTIPHPQSPSKQIEMLFIPEGDLYRLIAHSQLPAADQFERWVFDEVLPSIRKHGAYLTPETAEKVLTDPTTIISICQNWKADKERLAEANARIEADAPKVAFADSVSCSKSEILIRELAKMMTQNGVDIGEKRLFEQLRRDGYLINKPGGDYNSPTQRSMELGIMRVDEVSIAKSDGNVILRRTPKITGKGQIYFMTRYGRG